MIMDVMSKKMEVVTEMVAMFKEKKFVCWLVA